MGRVPVDGEGRVLVLIRFIRVFLAEMPLLESIDVALQLNGNHPWVAHLLRDFLPLELVRSIQGDIYGFLVLDRKSPTAVADKALVYHTYDETPVMPPFARMLVLLLVPRPSQVEAVLPYPLFELPVNDQPECVDYSPDCFEKAGLCKNDAFKEIMREKVRFAQLASISGFKCAKTCRICGEIVKEAEDFGDLLLPEPPARKDPTTSRSHRPFHSKAFPEWTKLPVVPFNNEREDEAMIAYGHTSNQYQRTDAEFENNEEYATSDEYLSGESAEHSLSVSTRPPTLVYPQPLPPPPTVDRLVPPSFHRHRPCFDKAPNCFYLKSLCFNQFYMPLLQKSCTRTCGFCSRKHGKTKWITLSKGGRGPHSRTTPVPFGACRDFGLDCDEKLKFCTRPKYVRFMRRVCAQSCNFCTELDY
ncbi:hypothetical protein M3Y99_01386500 [Aphelenchoides fujianensis]|nr:hypothetical protein M3Y99_01386500 [Aphelenchoides fujianensis]